MAVDQATIDRSARAIAMMLYGGYHVTEPSDPTEHIKWQMAWRKCRALAEASLDAAAPPVSQET